MEMIELKNRKSDVSRQQEPLCDRKLRYTADVLRIKNDLEERRKGYVVRGWSPTASAFLYSLYNAKTGFDFDKALMAKGEFFIPLYCGENIGGCSALGIVAIADSVLFTEKKEFIQKLLSYRCECESNFGGICRFVPTVKDKEFAFFAKLKECMPSIIQQIYFIRDVNFIPGMPEELKNYIAELLFWLKLDEKESLL